MCSKIQLCYAIQIEIAEYLKVSTTLLLYMSNGYLIIIILDIIYLHGVYIDPYFTKGIKGFRIYHDCDYFKERCFYHKDQKLIDVWIAKMRLQARYFDVNKKY